MSLMEWSKSSVGYGRKLVDSAIEGARTGESEFLKEEPLVPFLSEAAQQALKPAAIGACLGGLCGYIGKGPRSRARVLACGLIGGAIGFGAGAIWENRQFIATVASGIRKSIKEVRDAHWFEKNPIDYA
jgi:hypothetical protein